MNMMIWIALSLFMVMNSPDNGKKDQPSLYDTKWNLKKIHTDSTFEVVSTKAFIKFNREKKSGGGNGGCNSFGSDVIIRDNSISISHIFSTKMYCEGVQESENKFFRLLNEVNSYEIRGNQLLLMKGKQILLEFEKSD
jgi:heat shock protein HslJ